MKESCRGEASKPGNPTRRAGGNAGTRYPRNCDGGAGNQRRAPKAGCAEGFEENVPICMPFLSGFCDQQRAHGPNQSSPCGRELFPGHVAGKAFVYGGPFCAGSVASDVKTGQINHRTVCGNQFSAKYGHVAKKAFVYACPFCAGSVASDVKTGQIDHRTVCGNQFHVKEGAVGVKTRQNPQRCPACHTVVWSSQLFGRIRVAHTTPSGKLCSKKLASSRAQTKNKEMK